MANVLIKNDDQKRREARILREYAGVDTRRATREQREYAESISRRTEETNQKMKARDKK